MRSMRMFLEALTSRFHVVFFGLLPRTGFAVEHLVDLRRPLGDQVSVSVAVVEAATMLVSRFCVVTCHGCQVLQRLS
jgi:hypothetical protein